MSDSNDSKKQSSPGTTSISSAIIQLLSIPVIADFFQARPWITLVTLLTLFAGNIWQVFLQLPEKQTDNVNNEFTEFPITINDLESICISMESEIHKNKEQQIINYKSVELDDDATNLWPVFRWVCVYQAVSHDPIAGI